MPGIISGNLKLWLRADSGVITGVGGKVRAWQDQSPSGNHAYQSDLDKQPVLVQSGIGGWPSVRFDGLQDEILGDYLHGVGDVGLDKAFTSFLVYRRMDDTGAEKMPVLIGAPMDYNHVRSHYIPENYMAFSAWGNDYWSSMTIQTNVNRIWTLRMNDENSQLEFFDFDGQRYYQETQTVSGIARPAAGYYIGGLGWQTRNFKGDIAEVICFQGKLTETDRLKVEQYLETKYLSSNINSSRPIIVTQPQSQAVPPGTDVTFTVEAQGPGRLHYQWFLRGNRIGADSSALHIPAVRRANAGAYHVVITSRNRSVQSRFARLAVQTPIVIVSQPQNQTNASGRSSTFSVAVNGDSPNYQWMLSGSPISGATASSLILTNLHSTNFGSYSVLITNAVSSVMSSNAVLSPAFPPFIFSFPFPPRIRPVGTNVGFSVHSAGTGPLSYQWQFNSVDLANATSSELVITNIQTIDAGDYWAVVSNPYGVVTDRVQTLIVMTPAAILSQPQGAHVPVGTNVNFTVSASGDSLLYQWRLNGSSIFGATNSSLSITHTKTTDSGNYSVTVSNKVSSATSSDAHLLVDSLPLINSSPVILLQPQNATIKAGRALTLGVGLQNNFRPSDIGDLSLWLKADAGVVAANGRVSQWKDQSSATNHCSQSDPNKQPVLINDAINGNPTIEFDGIQSYVSGDYLEGTGSVGFSNDFTSFLLFRKTDDNIGPQGPFLVGGMPGFYGTVRAYYITQNKLGFSAWDNDYSTQFLIPSNSSQLWTLRLDPTKTMLEFFGTDGTNSFSTNTLVSGLQFPDRGYYVGGRSY